MTIPVHYQVINDFGIYAETNSACGNNLRRRKQLTDDYTKVTCRECLTLCGFEAAQEEQLTACEPDPLKRAA